MTSKDSYDEVVKECRSKVYPDIAIGVLVWAICSIVVWKGAQSNAHADLVFISGISIISSIIIGLAIYVRILRSYKKELLRLRLAVVRYNDQVLKIDFDYSKMESGGREFDRLVRRLQKKFIPLELKWSEIDHYEVMHEGIRLYPKGEAAVPVWVSSNIEGYALLPNYLHRIQATN